MLPDRLHDDHDDSFQNHDSDDQAQRIGLWEPGSV
jgi:hypothetical protein